tara:strand:- start:144 stop:371 length:228 start_codon:yes stop_codon:yes gene_type:complete
MNCPFGNLLVLYTNFALQVGGDGSDLGRGEGDVGVVIVGVVVVVAECGVGVCTGVGDVPLLVSGELLLAVLVLAV